MDETWTTVIDGKSMAIGVKCGCNNALRGHECYDFHGDNHYRPLTTLEVEAIFEKHNNPNDNIKTKGRLSREQTMRLIIIGVENGMITYKKQPCKLIPA